MDLLEEMKKEKRKEESFGEDEVAQYSVLEIAKGALGDNTRRFETAAELVYLVGEGGNENNHVTGIKNRYSGADGNVSYGKDGVMGDLRSEGLIRSEEIDGRKVSKLTELGEKVYDAVKPLFKGIYELNELKEAVDKFENRYGRKPKLNELSHLLGRDVEEKELYNMDGFWEPPENDDIDKQAIIGGFVLKNTSAEGIAAIEKDDILSIAFSETGGKKDEQIQEYTRQNEDFLDDLELEKKAHNVFDLKLDDFTSFVGDGESLVFRVNQKKKIREELSDLAD